MPALKLREHNRDADLLIEQVKLLFGAIPNSLLAYIFGSIVALAVFNGHIEPARLYFWLGLLWLSSLVRLTQYIFFRRSTLSVSNVLRWYWQFKIGSALIAVIVGSAGILLFSDSNASFQVTLVMMIVCIASFAITTLSPKTEIIVPFLLIIFIPVMISLYMADTEISSYVFWMMVLLMLLLLLSALRISRTIIKGIELTIDAAHREETLRKSQQRLAMYIRDTPLAVIEWNLDFQIEDWNKAAETIFGYTREEAIGAYGNELIFPPKLIHNSAEIWEKLMHSMGSNNEIIENRTRSGRKIICEWFNTPLIDNEDNVLSIMSLVQDVTEKIEHERIKNEFVSIVSHELRTPVTSIKASLALLSSGVLNDDKDTTREMIEVALLNANRLHLMLNDILDVEKLESGKVSFKFLNSDLKDLIEKVVQANTTYADKYHINVVTGILPEGCTAYIDPDRIFQVLTNLLSNAIKFSITEGTVTLSLTENDNYYRISINNRGEVIPDEDRVKLFTRFYQRDSSDTRSKEGSGLGLYICQKILEEHNSELDFDSDDESGTTFYFDLLKTSAD